MFKPELLTFVFFKQYVMSSFAISCLFSILWELLCCYLKKIKGMFNLEIRKLRKFSFLLYFQL